MRCSASWGWPKTTWRSDHGVWISIHFGTTREWLVACSLSRDPRGTDRRRDRTGSTGKRPRLPYRGYRRVHEGRETTASGGRRTFGTRPCSAPVACDREARRLRDDAHAWLVQGQARQGTRHVRKLCASAARSASQFAHVDHRQGAGEDEYGAIGRFAEGAAQRKGSVRLLFVTHR